LNFDGSGSPKQTNEKKNVSENITHQNREKVSFDNELVHLQEHKDLLSFGNEELDSRDMRHRAYIELLLRNSFAIRI
jgi:hypothetical protein